VTAFVAYILFDERLDSISMLGMLICVGGVALVNRGTSSSGNMVAQSGSKQT
jgi:drug/metabolite transporter (DMT)-like permease